MAKIVIAGGSGFLGQALVDELGSYEVVTTSRSGRGTSMAWDCLSVETIEPVLESAFAVINLVGEPINQRWTEAARMKILESRVQATQAIAEAISSCERPPRVWLNASAAGFYGDTGSREVDESAGPGGDFLAAVCQAWEAACLLPELPRTRRVVLRSGVVVGKGGGALPVLVKLTRWFLGGSVGSGRQFVPWITLADEVRLIRFCIEHEMEGPVNAVNPWPVEQREFMTALRSVLRRPWSPPAPEFAVKLAGAILGFPAFLALASQRVMPRVASEAGFEWRDVELKASLRGMTG